MNLKLNIGLLQRLSWLAALGVTPFSSAALSPISIKGSKLYRDDGTQFFAKGVGYAPSNTVDPLANVTQCKIDAGLMNAIGVNTIHVYLVDPSLNHDDCMETFASQGIFVWLELSNNAQVINRDEPAWTMDMYNNWTAAVDAFAKYDNLLTFSVGSSILNGVNSTSAAPYVKAAVRDIKAFRDARGYRPIPISYSAADDTSYRILMAEYLACGANDDGSSKDSSADIGSTIDLYGMAVFSWCQNSTYHSSGYDQLYTQFEKFNHPVLFSEAGCSLDILPHNFDDVYTMLGPVFQFVFSGAIVWQWGMPKGGDENNDGIVEYDNDSETGFPSLLSAYSRLSTVFADQNPTGTSETAYTPTNSAPGCPSSTSFWLVDAKAALPTIAGLDVGTVTARASWASTTAETRSTAGTGGSSSDATPDGKTHESGGGLSGGAIAGIVVGCIVGILVVAGTAFFLLRRRRAQAVSATTGAAEKDRSSGRSADADGDSPLDGLRTELPAHSVGRTRPRAEMEAPFTAQNLNSLQVHEMAAPLDRPSDLGAPYEMPASENRRPR